MFMTIVILFLLNVPSHPPARRISVSRMPEILLGDNLIDGVTEWGGLSSDGCHRDDADSRVVAGFAQQVLGLKRLLFGISGRPGARRGIGGAVVSRVAWRASWSGRAIGHGAVQLDGQL